MHYFIKTYLKLFKQSNITIKPIMSSSQLMNLLTVLKSFRSFNWKFFKNYNVYLTFNLYSNDVVKQLTVNVPSFPKSFPLLNTVSLKVTTPNFRSFYLWFNTLS